jgi:DNA-binding FadR family transcriptional regulator
LARDAADHLKARIADGSLAPGDRLPAERELAAQLGVSRPTVREAVGALVIMGLLESRQGAGTFVTNEVDEAANPGKLTIDIGYNPLAAVFELRLMLEPVAASRAAARIEDADLAELRRLHAELEANQGDTDGFVRTDIEFHRRIHIAAQSPLSLSILDGIGDLAFRSRKFSIGQTGAIAHAIDEHRLILEAIERREPPEAAAAMVSHVMQHVMHVRASLSS